MRRGGVALTIRRHAMHEIGLMKELLDSALEQAAASGMARVERVKVRVGALSGVDPECISQAFPVLARGTAAAGGRLEIEPVAASAVCPTCQGRFEPQERGVLCPRCDGLVFELERGEEFALVLIEGSGTR